MTLKLSNEKAIYLEWLKALINMYWSVNDKNLWIWILSDLNAFNFVLYLFTGSWKGMDNIFSYFI